MSTNQLASNSKKIPCVNHQVSLVVSLRALHSAHLTHEISAVLNRFITQPYTFLGNVAETINIDLDLSDPGLIASEKLARRLLRIKGVLTLKAERVCARRGPIYAINLKN
ncbi:MAG: hypothetical protein H8E36_02700 [Rhodospirillaceae bacterium]|nr:hypothetical protein [Rhodospirillaceae bacterium]MBL6930590.1 hypothetical protein [Rhodospirillales bacterium]